MTALFLGYQKNDYTNKDSKLVEGYNIFYATQDPEKWRGFKPSLIWDRQRKSFGLRYLSKKTFDKLGFSESMIGKFVELIFDESGIIEKVSIIKE